MFLRSLEVRNFRGIVSGRLDLGETTVLIGENDCGKSSLLSALSVALSGEANAAPRVENHHFHRPADPGVPPQGPIRIELLFEERAAGEWNTAAAKPLAPLLVPAPTGNRRLKLVIDSVRRNDGALPETHWRIAPPGGGGAGSEDDPEQLAAIRRMTPLIWLRSGMLLGEAQPPPAGETEAPDREVATLASEVESHYQALLSGTSSNELEELKAGYEAARELLRRRAEEYHSTGSLSHTPISDVLGARRDAGRPAGLAFHGSAAQQIGVLIVTAAVIRQGLGKWSAGTTPLLVVEDPEAHLHLMTLASVWGLLEHARAQKLVSTQSETLLAAAPLSSIRRLTRFRGVMRQSRVGPDALDKEELRKLSYHVRARRGEAMFARCWLLVEGETEFWMLPELARSCGYDLNLEGVACVEFAQCGVEPLVKLARELGIEWHVMTDGDHTGRDYADEARRFAEGDEDWHITRLRERDVEHCFWRHGYAQVYLQAAGLHVSPGHKVTPGRVIGRAIKRHSKPYLAFEALAAVAAKDSAGVPKPLRHVIDTVVQLAREAPERAGAGGERRPRRQRRGRRPRRGK